MSRSPDIVDLERQLDYRINKVVATVRALAARVTALEQTRAYSVYVPQSTPSQDDYNESRRAYTPYMWPSGAGGKDVCDGQ